MEPLNTRSSATKFKRCIILGSLSPPRTLRRSCQSSPNCNDDVDFQHGPTVQTAPPGGPPRTTTTLHFRAALSRRAAASKYPPDD
ncbi:hypothetical protein Zmor_006380 [Zophobas morio]|uniref:Uncharacterized protein n=1 Tax=Zophobas morio TaxID=2755281 RepID=A0AA38IS92_9CUCU|nr:hypothetical protein Zmor_006380 [Zophobas morio]